MTPREELGPVLAGAVQALVAERVRVELAALQEELRPEPWPAYLSVPDAATYSGMSEGRVRKLIERHVLPVVQEAPSHRVLIARDDLDTLLRSWRS